MTFDDLGMLQDIAYLGANNATAKRMKVDLYCQRQRCDPLNVLFNIMFLVLT